jgi:hypothetical protein
MSQKLGGPPAYRALSFAPAGQPGLGAGLKRAPERRVRARGLQETTEIAAACRPDPLTGRVCTRRLELQEILRGVRACQGTARVGLDRWANRSLSARPAVAPCLPPSSLTRSSNGLRLLRLSSRRLHHCVIRWVVLASGAKI